MTHRGLVLVCALLIAVAVLTQGPVAAQAPGAGSDSWTLPRTPDGQPDLQGVWANNAATPLERPEIFEGRTELTEEEAATIERRAHEILNSRGDVQIGEVFGELLFRLAAGEDLPPVTDPIVGNYNTFWLADRDFDNRTSLIVDPPDGRIPPLTPEGQQRAQARPKLFGGSRPAGPGEFPTGPEDLTVSVRCISYGAPRLGANYNSYFQILQTPSSVAILQELIHDARIIPLDGRPHLNDGIRQWHGDSRGHWEGDTLVVETTNYSPKTSHGGANEHLTVTERFTRVGPDTIRYEATFEDPTTWTAPWTAMIPLKRSDGAVFEYGCHEGNYSMENILAGARVQEAASK